MGNYDSRSLKNGLTIRPSGSTDRTHWLNSVQRAPYAFSQCFRVMNGLWLKSGMPFRLAANSLNSFRNRSQAAWSAGA